MGYVAARCPNCGGDLQLDDTMEKGYCSHCGTPIYFKEAIQKIKIVGPVEIAGFAKLDSLIKLIKKDLEFGMNRTPEFRDRLNRALELDPGNQYLYDLQSSEIWEAKIVEGNLIVYNGNAKRFVVPDCVSTIKRFCFKAHNKLTEVVLPRSISHIADGAFYREDRITMSAYKNTYAARYALVSPAFLQIIDDDEQNQEHIRSIEEQLSEIVDFKSVVEREIKIHYRTKFFGRLAKPFIVLFALIIIAFFIPNGFQSTTVKLLTGIIVILASALAIAGPAYVDTCRRLAKKNQIMKFYKKSNVLLGPLGITDFKYLKNIWESSNIDLAYEAKYMEKVKNQILNMDRQQFLRDPDVSLTFLSYVAGNRPTGLENY